MTITIPQQNIKMDVATGIDPVWYGKLQALIAQVNTLIGGLPPLPFVTLSASLPADVLLNNTVNYFPGPSIAQGTVGTWFVSGTVTFTSTTGDNIAVKLWDGTNVVASAATTVFSNLITSVSLSGIIANPVSNLRISARDVSAVNGKMTFNTSGNSKDSTISAFRIA